MLLTADSLRVPHGFFTRQGGVSTGPYTSLNCSLSSGDARDAVLENRTRAARAIGANPDRLVGLMQVHGPDVVEVETPWSAGAGPRADAMVTNRPDIALGIITADCAPILFADAEAGVVGAAHAGWRGAVAGVIEATVAAMTRLGARPGRIASAIGPCIRQVSYEVAADLRDAVLRHNPFEYAVLCPGTARGALAVRSRRLLRRPPRRRRHRHGPGAGGRHRRGRGTLLQLSPDHAERGWTERAPDLHHRSGGGLEHAMGFPPL